MSRALIARVVSGFRNETSGTIVVTLGLLISNTFSYLLQIILGRKLSVIEYGEFNSLLSLAYILGVPAGAFAIALIKVSAELKAQEKFKTLTYLLVHLSTYFFIFGVLTLLVLFFMRLQVASYLNIPESGHITEFAIYGSLLFVGIVPASYLQGLLRFKGFALWSVMSGFMRLILPTLLVVAGLGVSGAYRGLALSLAISYLLGILILKKNLRVFSIENAHPYYKRILVLAASAFFLNIGMTLLNNIDIILVKHYFEPLLAGQYSAVVTVGKVLLFGCSTVTVVMFPQISALWSRKEDYMPVFKKFLTLQLGLILAGSFAFMLFPKLLTQLFFGQGYLVSAEFIPWFSVFVGLYVLINFFAMFFLAIDEKKIFSMFFPAILLQGFLINRYHSSIGQVIFINILISVLILFFIVVYYMNRVSLNHRPSLQKTENN